MIHVALGTNSPPKIKYIEEVLKELSLDAEIFPFEVESGVSSQPMTEEETKEGSINRAKEAFKLKPDADFSMGIEVGYHQGVDENYDIFCWVTILDKNHRATSHKSTNLRLPNFHQQVIRDGLYLGEHVDAYIEQVETQEEKNLGIAIKTREPFIKEAIEKALKNYFESQK